MVRGNRSDWIHKPCVIAKAENFLSGAVDLKFAVGFDKGGANEIKRAEAVVDDIGLEDGATFAEECLTQAFAISEVRGREHLEGFGVANCVEIRFSNMRNDRDVRREIEVDGNEINS